MFRYIVFLSLLLSLGLSGCAAKRDYAKVRRNFGVEKFFRSGELLPQYRYYYNGPAAEPVALMALDRQYTLRSQFWHEFTSGYQMQQWVKDFDRLFGHFDDIGYVSINYRGAEIISRDNQRVGMIYSKYDWVVVWWGEGNEIYVTQPEPSGNQRLPLFFHRRGDW